MRPRPILKKLAAEVRQRRQERNLTQEELAHVAGVNVNTLKRLEWAATDCQILTLFGVATGLNMPLADLIAGVERRR